jgi:hypothetical protein
VSTAGLYCRIRVGSWLGPIHDGRVDCIDRWVPVEEGGDGAISESMMSATISLSCVLFGLGGVGGSWIFNPCVLRQFRCRGGLQQLGRRRWSWWCAGNEVRVREFWRLFLTKCCSGSVWFVQAKQFYEIVFHWKSS